MTPTVMKAYGWTYIGLGVLTGILMVVANAPTFPTWLTAGWVIGLGLLQLAAVQITTRRANRGAEAR